MVAKAIEKKTKAVDELTANFKQSPGLYIADFTGVTVGKVTALRNDLRKRGMKMKVAKNTLIRRALGNLGIKGLDSFLAGPTAVIMSDDQDPMAPAKVLIDFHKANADILPVKVVSIDGAAYPGTQLMALSKMPGKRELQAGVVSLALGPGAQVIGLIKGPGSKVAGQLKALVEKLEGGAA